MVEDPPSDFVSNNNRLGGHPAVATNVAHSRSHPTIKTTSSSSSSSHMAVADMDRNPLPIRSS